METQRLRDGLVGGVLGSTAGMVALLWWPHASTADTMAVFGAGTVIGLLLPLQVDLLDPALPTGPELGSLGDDRVDDLPRRAVTLDRPFDAPRAQLDVRGRRCAFGLLEGPQPIVPGIRRSHRQFEAAC